MSAAADNIRKLLAELAEVLDSPEAREPVEAVRGKSGVGYRTGKQRLADARQWIDDIRRRLQSADEDLLRSLLSEVGRVSEYVMYVGDRRDITLEGTEPGIVAWRRIKEQARTYRHYTGPNWHSGGGPYWPNWTIVTSDS